MRILVVNCGSSSIKYKLFDMTDERALAGGVLERLGQKRARLHHAAGDRRFDRPQAAADHAAGLRLILDVLADRQLGVIERIEQIDGVGHRVVHGGERISGSTLVDADLLEVVEANAALSPLHNPANLAGITAAMQALPRTPQVAVFDTAFFSTLPAVAYRYAVPEQWYRRHHVRRYGFHGTSHRCVTERAAELLARPLEQVNLITVHLGNGCSVTAVAGGKAIDHSMGLTPLEGLMMGTRSGDLDPAVIFYMARQAGMSVEELDRALNNDCGLLGVSGVSNDMRDVRAAAAEGNQQAAVALEMFAYRVAKYVGAYYAILPGCDAVVLTGGIGENSAPVRADICRRLANLGVRLDEGRNQATVAGKAGPITADGARPGVWVVPTDEELVIARDTREIVLRSA